MKVCAFATIKMNSQRLPHKNIKLLDGKPLCQYILNTALSVREIENVYVYCSDSAIKNYIPPKVKYLNRDICFDNNNSKANEIYASFVEKINADIYVALGTPSPFIKKESLEIAIRKVMSGEYDSAFSVRKFQTFAWNKGKPINYSLTRIPRTQDISPVFIETSGFYVFKKEIIEKYSRRIGLNPYMHVVDEIEGIDIDTKENFEFAEKMLGHSLI